MGVLSLRIKRPGREADHSPPSCAEVKNSWSYTSAPPVRLHGVVVKHRYNWGYLSGRAPNWLDDRGFKSRQRLGIFLFTTASRPAVRPVQLPTQWVSGVLSLRIKRSGRDTDHSPPSSAEVNSWSYTSTLPYVMAWYLVKHRCNRDSSVV
jgi:hypothetical protein